MGDFHPEGGQAAHLTREIVEQGMEALLVKRIPRLDEIPPDRLVAEGIDPATLLPYEN